MRITENTSIKQKVGLQKAAAFSVAIDESTDVEDMARIAIVVAGRGAAFGYSTFSFASFTIFRVFGLKKIALQPCGRGLDPITQYLGQMPCACICVHVRICLPHGLITGVGLFLSPLYSDSVKEVMK